MMSHSHPTCPIAIVGMACRYPDANTVEELFENSIAQRRSFRQIPEGRLGAAYFSESQSADRSYARQAAVLNGFQFDRQWFRVPQSSYDVTDLTHWLALTVASEAIEDVRFRKHRHPDNEAVRVVVGNTLTGEFSRANVMRLRWPYVKGAVAQQLQETYPDMDAGERSQLLRELEVRYKRPFPAPNEDFLAGGLANTIAGRICNHFDFKGGGYTIDGACSSSLLAVADGCSALVSGDADMAIVGGVDLSLDPFELVGFSRSAALARHEMRVYDERSEGFWPGEGCGFAVLMRYEDAVEQCDRVYAVIRGWGVSSDGRGGLTRPEPAGQRLALNRCYRRAGYGIETVGYFEGHGTGTKVGDAAELQALIAARSESGHPICPATIASIKANIGHTKAAAGLAGLLRATQCVSENLLPPTTACPQPHALFAESNGTLAPGDRLRDWKANGVARRAGISAMGFGGINTHLTIEEAPASGRTTVAAFKGDDLARLRTYQDTELFLFSASSRYDLAWTIDYLAGFVGECSRAELTDLAVELARRATRGSLSIWRAAATAATPAELARKLVQLREIMDRSPDDSIHLAIAEGTFLSSGNPHGRIGLVFPGQGVPARATGGIHARRFDEVRRTYQQAGLERFDRQEDSDFAQPAIVTASLAGLKLLQRLGTQADVAVGYSLGELVALHWAGCFDDRSLLDLARWRGQATVDDPESTGAMVALAMDGDRAAAAIGDRENLFVANLVSPRQTVVSGDRAEVEALAARMRREGITATVLPLQRAFHTPLMAGVAAAFRDKLEGIQLGAVDLPVISTVTGRPLAADTDIATYLGEQLLSPVHFLTAIERTAKGVDLFIEVGPGHTMANLTRGICDTPIASLDVGSDSLAPFLNAAAAAYVLGRTPTMAQLFGDRFARRFNWGWTPKFLENPCEAVAVELPLEAEVEPEVAPALPVPSLTSDESSNTRDRVRQIVAERTGLPAWTLQDNSRMSADLHLNSITVGEIVARATASMGLQPPVDPTEYAHASISDIATALDRLQELGAGQSDNRPKTPSGVGSWVRCFEVAREPAPPLEPGRDRVLGTWEGFGAIGEPERALLQQLNAEPHGNGTIVWLSQNPDKQDLQPLWKGARRCIERSQEATEPLCFVVIQSGWGASGFARSFFLEHETVRTRVVNLDPRSTADPTEAIAAEIQGATPGFQEIFIDATGERQQPCLKFVKAPAPPTATPSLVDASDVVLVTGGGKGISAECGYQLARQTGCALAILGRSAPPDSTELANNLDRLRQAGVRVSYQIADVTDAAGVAAAVDRAVAELGSPVTGIVHGAGANHPCAIANLSLARFEATVSPKVDGLENVLAAIDPTSLKLLVGFSSIIARLGMHGEADYALGNEWLSCQIEAFQLRYPHCRCRAIEWSVWSGTGMGERLGRLDALIGQGISPISVDDGIREFLRVIDTPDLPIRSIVSGRFGKPTTLAGDRPPQKPFRFIETLPVYYPQIEAIAEFRLSSQSDPYLDDHVFEGERLFPAVMSLEAMAEVAVVLMGPEQGAPAFRDVAFRKAIAIPKSAGAGKIVVRLAALADESGELSMVLRCSTTDFQVNHVEARCTWGDRNHLNPLETEDLPASDLQPFDPDRCLYGNILFQTGRFQKIQGYHAIETRRCRGQLSFDGAAKWFDGDLPQESLLGDPGIRDASLHAIQVCIPHKIAIPIAAEEVCCGRLDPHQSYRTLATEIADRGDELVYDLTIFDADGRAIERWRKLVLRVVGRPPHLRLNSPLLAGPFVERQVADRMPQAQLKVTIAPTTHPRTTTPDPNHRPDGKPDPRANSCFHSAAYSGGWKLAIEGAIPVGCDLQCVSPRQVGDWKVLLGEEGIELAQVVARLVGESLDISATRVWTAREAMKKAGLSASAPLVVEPDSEPQWVAFKSGDAPIFSSLIDLLAPDRSICVAVSLPPHSPSPIETGAGKMPQ